MPTFLHNEFRNGLEGGKPMETAKRNLQPGPGLIHDFGCTFDPCRCRQRQRNRNRLRVAVAVLAVLGAVLAGVGVARAAELVAIEQAGSCDGPLTWTVTGDQVSFEYWRDGNVYASANVSDEYVLLGTVFGVPGQPVDTGGFGPLKDGTHRLVVFGHSNTAEASITCGDGWTDYDEQLNNAPTATTVPPTPAAPATVNRETRFAPVRSLFGPRPV